MTARRPLWLWAALLAGLGYAGWEIHSRFFAGETGTERLTNQLWVDRAARDDRDLVHHLVLVDRERRRVGVVGRASRWRVHADVFLWGLDGKLLRTRFPQEQKRLAFRVRTWRCAGEAPRPFELCLELERDGRRARFYSREDWVVREDGTVSAAPEAGGAAAALQALGRAPAQDPALEDGAEAPPGLGPLE